MSELPASWAEVTLGELCDVVSGSTPRTTIAEYWGGDIPWITPDDLSGYARKTISRGSRSITDLGYESCSTRMVPAGTVLFTSRAPIGYVAIASQPVCTNQGFKSFVPSNGLVSDYVYWFLKYATPDVRQLASGTTFPELSKARAIEISVPVPPLAEQHRVVAAIEEQFSRIEVAEALLLRTERNLCRLDASAISRALRGDWPIVALGQVTDSQIYGSSAKADADPDGVPILRMGNIRNGTLDLEELKYLARGHPDVEKCRLSHGDLLFNRTNSPGLVGKCAVFRQGPDPTVFASYLIRVRLNRECEPEWAAHVINSSLGRRYIASVRTQQVGQANVNGTKLAAMPIPLPPIQEQRRIIGEVELQRSITASAAGDTDRALRRAATLRRSILERAFTGRLVPQDPSDEPASVLLERIAAERAPPPKPRAPRRRRAGVGA